MLRGDKNTEYFHRIVNGRKSKKLIFSLKHEQDVIQGTPDLLKQATAFYKDLLGPVVGFTTRLADNNWVVGEVLNNNDRREMDKPL